MWSCVCDRVGGDDGGAVGVRAGGSVLDAVVVSASDAGDRGGPDCWNPGGASGVGSARIVWQLEREGVAPGAGAFVGVSGVAAVGVDRGAEASPAALGLPAVRERGRSMALWQMDVVGRMFPADGTELSAVTGIDDHSRMLCVGATGRPGNCAARM